MEPSDSYNCAIRVKEDALLIENDSGIIDEKPDFKNLQLLLLPPESSNQTVRKCDKHRESELDNEVEITFECENLKPQMNLSVHEKIDDYSQSHLRNVKDSDGYKIQNAVRIEYVEEVKQTFFGDAEKSNLNFECELARLDKRRIIRKKLNNEHNLKTHVGTMNSDTTHACDVCVKTFSQSQHLKFHIDKVHHKITSSYDMCGKSFSLTGYVAHIDAVHNGVPHACHICGKKYITKGYLKAHIDKVHNNIICYICRKTFAHKGYLQTHIDSVHITHSCDMCGKTLCKSSLKTHVDKMHKDVRHACDTCGKKFSWKSDLKNHIDTAHDGVKHTCDTCQKTFTQKSNLKSHIDTVHKGVKNSCNICGKSFAHRRNIKAHINAVHNGILKVSTTSNMLSADETLIRCITHVLQLNKNISSEN